MWPFVQSTTVFPLAIIYAHFSHLENIIPILGSPKSHPNMASGSTSRISCASLRFDWGQGPSEAALQVWFFLNQRSVHEKGQSTASYVSGCQWGDGHGAVAIDASIDGEWEAWSSQRARAAPEHCKHMLQAPPLQGREAGLDQLPGSVAHLPCA